MTVCQFRERKIKFPILRNEFRTLLSEVRHQLELGVARLRNKYDEALD